MGQITIYLNDETEKKMKKAAKEKKLSYSRYITQIIEEKVANRWPKSVVEAAGTWNDFPDRETINAGAGIDAHREDL